MIPRQGHKAGREGDAERARRRAGARLEERRALPWPRGGADARCGREAPRLLAARVQRRDYERFTTVASSRIRGSQSVLSVVLTKP